MSVVTHPFQIADYRRFWFARLLMVSCSVSMVVLLGYQTYDIARADYGFSRDSGAMLLGMLGLAQFVPLFVLSPVAGWAADKWDRRIVAACGCAADFAIALLLAILTWRDVLTLPILFILAGVHGGARAFLGPAMSSITANVVPPNLLPKAIALGAIAWQAASILGPAAGGFLYAESTYLPYAICALGIFAGALLVMQIRPIRAKQLEDGLSPIGQILEGARFMMKSRFLLGCVSLDLFAVLLAGASALLPVYARDILMVGPEGLGLMRGAIALGAAAVALIFSFKPMEYNVGERMLYAVAIFGGATVCFGLSRSFALSIAALLIMGAADMISVYIRSSLVQLNTPDQMRGRVSSISTLAISASNELGEMQSGLAAAILGATGAVVFGGFGAIAITAIWAVLFPEIRAAKRFSADFLKQ